MALFIDTKTVQKAVDRTGECHLVPCDIDFSGEANVDNYFSKLIEPKASTDDDLTVCFRGRPLNGSVIKLPSGYTGLVMKEPHKNLTEDEDRTIVVTHKFEDFTYWNLDKQTTPDDLIQKALQWIEISNVLHQPVATTEWSQNSSQQSLAGQ